MAFRVEPQPATDSARPPDRVRGRGRALGKGRFRGRFRGQGLVEFAISLPVVLLMIGFGIDFGRVFLGWVQLSNAVREAANFAAINPKAWTAPGSPAAQAEFERLITTEATGINCTLPATIPDPTFPTGTDIGSPAVVAITCQFSLITPLVSTVLGSPIPVSASSSFPIRSGMIAGTGSGGGLLSFAPVVPTPSAPGPTAPPVPTVPPIPTAPPTCKVPDLKNDDSSIATGKWTAAGFTANNLGFNPLVPPHYRIRTQTLTKNSMVACTSSMTVTP
jgi:Flp pilus assembly protein TadG